MTENHHPNDWVALILIIDAAQHRLGGQDDATKRLAQLQGSAAPISKIDQCIKDPQEFTCQLHRQRIVAVRVRLNEPGDASGNTGSFPACRQALIRHLGEDLVGKATLTPQCTSVPYQILTGRYTALIVARATDRSHAGRRAPIHARVIADESFGSDDYCDAFMASLASSH